jgi:small subunit ribosomal protein S1
MPDRDKPDESFATLFETSKKSQSPRRRAFDVGTEADVVVVSIGKESVFVELDGKQEGFVDAKELRNAKGDLTVKIGSRVRARVVEVGGRAGAIRLSPVFVRPPASEGDEVVEASGSAASGPTLAVGARVKGTVSSIERYGVFVSIAGTGEGRRQTRGLLPLAESGLPRGADPHKHLPVGKEVEAKVIAIDDRGRIRLSITQLAADEERKAFESYANKPESPSAPTRGFGTLGDLLKKK